MSLKSRLLNKKNTIKTTVEAETPYVLPSKAEVLDVISYFENNSEISSLQIYGPNKVFAQKQGIKVEADIHFEDTEAILNVIENIANKYDKIINWQNPSFNIVLSNGIKISAIIPPLIEKGAYLSLQKTPKYSKNSGNIISEKLISNEMVLFLKECLKLNLNIFITGDANTDKTTFLNFLANNTDEEETLICIESAPQIKVRNDRALKLIKHKGNFQKTVKKALNLSHDRIIISNSNITELISLYEHINSGYNGFLVSFSTKSYRELIESLQNLILLSHPNIVEQNANALIASSMDILVNVSKTKDGQERITNIGEIVKVKNNLKVEDLFVWKESTTKTNKFDGKHISTGAKSRFFGESNLSALSFREEYFEKEHKHNYINAIESVSNQVKSSEESPLNKLKKYKTLKKKP